MREETLQMNNNYYGVVMAGGGGTRLWPASRQGRPKQLMALGTGKTTLLRGAVERAAALAGEKKILVITAKDQAESVGRELRDLHAEQIIVEPVGRNTAPCIGLAAALLFSVNENAVMAVLPADHHVRDEKTFKKAALTALRQASKGYIVTLGIRPDRPETGYGYIEIGESVSPKDGVYWSKGFVEKPDVKTAERYLKEGKHLWNSGMFFMSAKKILSEMDRFMPELAAALYGLTASYREGRDVFEGELKQVYPSLEAVSIDYGVMEKVDEIQVIPTDPGWNDLGSWAALEDILVKDDKGNAVEGDVHFVGSENCIAYSDDGRTIALLGVEDLIVVSSSNGVLVCPKQKAQDVRLIVDALKSQTGSR